MYSTQAVSRPELSEFLEEAQAAEKYFIAQRLAPVHGVGSRAGRYPKLKIKDGNLMRRDLTKRNSTGSYNEITRKHEWDTFDCEDRGLEERIDDTKAAEMKSFFDMEVLTTKLVRRAVMLDFEVRTANLFMNAATFLEQQPFAAYTEATIEDCDVPQDINEAVEQLIYRGVEVNTMVMSRKVWSFVRRSTKLQQYLYGKLGPDTQKRLITPKDLQDAFDIETVHVASAAIDTSNRAKDSVLGPIWGTSHIWIGSVKSGDFSAGGAARTLTWEADVPNGLYATETYRDEKRRSDMARVRANAVEKIIDETAGQLIKTDANF